MSQVLTTATEEKIQQGKEKTVAISHRVNWECPSSRVTFTQRLKGTRQEETEGWCFRNKAPQAA